jgi:hypothetical protein
MSKTGRLRCALGRIERFVCSNEQLFRIISVGIIGKCDAVCSSYRENVLAPQDGGAQLGQEAGDVCLDYRGWFIIRNDHGELVATYSCGQKCFGKARGQPFGEDSEAGVAGQMTQSIIDPFEPIQIEEEQRAERHNG